ncbi:Oidioi.mRNA.OKI2018_I69.PAR.g12152.t1.cds [Oikopleura dioica]|uniref:Actin-related protein 2/3 complex subunit 5 n=1 Tax=Oikopleura dioica TaxID=34765 RepID=A0ABN7RZC1_OIKDI|nr:Oidioi.mRNA.OKI2018_I69.PAR.g12152.t1.cds [Oikopleura dioica]
MTTSSLSRDFRKINIEQYEEDFYEDEIVDNGARGPDMNQVQSFISAGKPQDALKVALQNAPTCVNNPQTKKTAAEIVVRALTSHKNSQIQPSVDSLTPDELDILMKYIYKAFSLNQDSNTCASLLQWHDKVHTKAGSGAIVRVLADRERL